MYLALVPTQVVRMELRIQVDDGVTFTVFPMSERWLRQTSDHAWAVNKVRGKCKPENFRSLMDFLYANVFPDRYWEVMNFYAGAGKPVREILTKDQCYEVDRRLIEALKLAYEDYCEDRERSWSRIRRTSDQRYLRSAG